jgi:hypothetical protein
MADDLCTCSGSAPDANGQTDQIVDPACPMCGEGEMPDTRESEARHA